MLEGDDGKQQTASASPEAKPKQQQAAGESTDQAQQTQQPEITADQAELLSRWHMKPEMVAGWDEAQRNEFFENAAKREADQRRFGQEKDGEKDELIKRLEKLEQARSGQQGEGDEQTTDTATGDDADLGELGTQFETVISDLVDTYGDEFGALRGPITGIIKRSNAAEKALQQANSGMQQQSRIIVDLVVDKGINDLATDYPTLSKAEPRQQVEAKFMELWKADDSQFRTGKEPFHIRVQKGLKAAADALLGTTTEAAAQVNLVNKTKQRLTNQPGDGAGRAQNAPQTEDEMYDQAFEQTIGKSL